MSIEYANMRNYLDDLFRVYPTIPDGIRDINDERWESVTAAFTRQDNISLITHLLYLDLFPVKDSYVAFLKRDHGAIERNPETINRLCGRLYEMGLDKILKNVRNLKKQIGKLVHYLSAGYIQKHSALLRLIYMNL